MLTKKVVRMKRKKEGPEEGGTTRTGPGGGQGEGDEVSLGRDKDISGWESVSASMDSWGLLGEVNREGLDSRGAATCSYLAISRVVLGDRSTLFFLCSDFRWDPTTSSSQELICSSFVDTCGCEATTYEDTD